MSKLKDIMTRDVQLCRAGDTLAQAAKTMWENDCGCVPIVDGEGKPVGMLTDRDICMAAQITGRPLAELSVESAMSKQLFSCKSTDSVEAVEASMREHQVRRMPIVDDGKLVGILSMNDLVRVASESKGRNSVRFDEIDATLAAIGQPRFQRITSRPSAS